MKDSFVYVGTAAIIAGTIISIAFASNAIHSTPTASRDVDVGVSKTSVVEVETPPVEPEAEVASESETEPVSEAVPEPEAEPEAVVVEDVSEVEEPSDETTPLQSGDSNPDMTMSQKQALGKAKNYLEFSAYSYEGLIRQLEFEKFDNADATFAADNCGADWNEQAAKKAKQYLEFQNYSLDELVHQLEFEGFTEEQATYGANEAYKED